MAYRNAVPNKLRRRVFSTILVRLQQEGLDKEIIRRLGNLQYNKSVSADILIDDIEFGMFLVVLAKSLLYKSLDDRVFYPGSNGKHILIIDKLS